MKKLLTTALVITIYTAAWAGEPIIIRGINGREVQAEVVRAGTVALVVRVEGETNETAVPWKQIDMEHLRSTHPEVAKMKADAEDRAKNGIFAENREKSAPKPVFPDTRPKDGGLTFRELLKEYCSGAPAEAAYKVKYFKQGTLGTELLAQMQQLADESTKAKDPRAAIYRRALEKLTQQLKESGVRRDAQDAVADMLKALEGK